MERKQFLLNAAFLTVGTSISIPRMLNAKNVKTMDNNQNPGDNSTAFKSRFSKEGARVLLGGGGVLKFLATGKETNGQYAMFEAKVKPGMEPPPHTHTHEDETYFILEGEMWLKAGDKEFVAKKGDYVFLPRKVQHEFKVLSESVRCHVGIYPAGLENFFMEISKPHDSEEIPPIDTEPPAPEVMESIMALNQKFGIY